MSYRKVNVELIVSEDAAEVAIQTFAEFLERFGESTTVYNAEIRDEETGTPENAEQIAAK